MPSTDPQTEQTASAQRLDYEPPRLSVLGDLRQLTLGGSLGRGDSGNASIQQR